MNREPRPANAVLTIGTEVAPCGLCKCGQGVNSCFTRWLNAWRVLDRAQEVRAARPRSRCSRSSSTPSAGSKGPVGHSTSLSRTDRGVLSTSSDRHSLTLGAVLVGAIASTFGAIIVGRTERRRERQEVLREAVGQARRQLGPDYPSGVRSSLTAAQHAAKLYCAGERTENAG